MGTSRAKLTGRGDKGGSFVSLPHVLIESDQWRALDGWTVKLIVELLAAYKGKNNGDLALTWNQAKERGWKSPGTLNRAYRQAIKAGFITKTRQGGSHRCSLYAVTFRAIDECKGKHDAKPTITPPHNWKEQSL